MAGTESPRRWSGASKRPGDKGALLSGGVRVDGSGGRTREHAASAQTGGNQQGRTGSGPDVGDPVAWAPQRALAAHQGRPAGWTLPTGPGARVQIPKPGGGMRELGIPTVVDLSLIHI